MLFFLLIEQYVCIFMFFEFEFSIFFFSSEPLLLNSGELGLFNSFIVEFIPFFLFIDEGIVMATFRCTWMNNNTP